MTKRIPLHTKILIGLVLGAIAGFIAQNALGADNVALKAFVKEVAQPLGQVFLRLIFMVVVPLLFSALVLGISGLGDVRKIGRIGFRSLGFTIVLSSLAVGIGLLAVNTFNPGTGVDPTKRDALIAAYASDSKVTKAKESADKAAEGVQALVQIISDNPLRDATEALTGGLMPFMFFSLMFGIALTTIPPEKAQPMKAWLEALFAVSQRIIEYAMKIAPYAVFFLVFSATAILGVDALLEVGKYVLVVLGALAFHQFVVYSLVLKFIAKRNPWQFFRQIRSVMMTAFATSSSNATLPVALKSAREDVGLPRNISSFVLTVGATANQNGTALFEGITVLFLAKFFGVDLNLGQQLTVMLLAIVAGIGTAGVPGGAWPMIMVILAKFGIPPEAIGLVIGIDRILDMSRTVLNVTGDITIAACVTAMEGDNADTSDLIEADSAAT